MRPAQVEDAARFTLKVVPPFRLDLRVWARAVTQMTHSEERSQYIDDEVGTEDFTDC